MHSQGLQGQVEKALEFITLQAPSGSSIFPKLTPTPPRHGLPNTHWPARDTSLQEGLPLSPRETQVHRQVLSVRKIPVPGILLRD